MPTISAIPAIRYAAATGGADVSALIAPPYDVLDARTKAALLAQSPENIVAVDLPHLPAKAVGPDETYARAGKTFRGWLDGGVLVRQNDPAMFVYQQTYDVQGRRFQRRGLFANVGVQPFGKSPTPGQGGVHPHEQTFASAKEDRLKLMLATGVQLSPIFGLYSDAQGQVAALLDEVVSSGPATMAGRTPFDGVLHEAWSVSDARRVAGLTAALQPRDIFIADGHHRYNTALNYLDRLKQSGAAVPEAARQCMFVLVAMQDPGMIVLPTHRVLGGMGGFTFTRLVEAARGLLHIAPFDGADPAALEAAIHARPPGEHAMGLVSRRDDGGLHLAIATTAEPDPLRATHPNQSEAWRSLDVAIVQHVIVDRICQPTFSPGQDVAWKFPHELDELMALVKDPAYQLGVIVRPTPLESVRRVAEAGELMPQKSTFFYPKLATGMVINPLA